MGFRQTPLAEIDYIRKSLSKPFVCNMASATEQLQRPLQRPSRGRPCQKLFRFYCKECTFSSEHFSNARLHVDTHHIQRPRQRCIVENCRVTFGTCPSQRRHLERHNAKDRLVECLYCRQQNKPSFKVDFANTTLMRWHVCESHAMVMSVSRLFHAFPKLSNLCRSAEADAAVDYGEWLRAVRVANGEPVAYDFTLITGRGLLLVFAANCRFCSYRVLNARTKFKMLNRHYERHLNKLYEAKSFVCSVGTTLDRCRAAFAALDNLQLHAKKVHNLPLKPFSGLLIDRCIICDQVQNSFDEFMHHLRASHQLKAIKTVLDLHYLNGIYHAERENTGIMLQFFRIKVTSNEPQPSMTKPATDGANSTVSSSTSFCYVDECRHVIRKMQDKQQLTLWSKVVKKTYRRYVRHQQAAGNAVWREKDKFVKKLEKRMRACGKVALTPVTIVKDLHSPIQ